MHRKFFAFVLLTASILQGCTPNIIERDFEKEEAQRIKDLQKAKEDPFKNQPTPDYVKLIEEDGVYVEALKQHPVKGPGGVMLDVWVVNAVNTAEDPQCVTVNWKLQDFEFESDEPYEFLVPAHKTLKIGKMKQTIWSFDDTFIAIPPSGYVDGIRVREPNVEKLNGKIGCETPEEDIQEK